MFPAYGETNENAILVGYTSHKSLKEKNTSWVYQFIFFREAFKRIGLPTKELRKVFQVPEGPKKKHCFQGHFQQAITN